MRPDIVFFNESLDKEKIEIVDQLLKTRPTHVIILGTSLQFPYLRRIVEKAKDKGAKVIHINPDPNYISLSRNEQWLKMNSSEGLKDVDKILEKLKNPKFLRRLKL
jgi:NAD-dependent SIR2 family protein deacetylase